MPLLFLQKKSSILGGLRPPMTPSAYNGLLLYNGDNQKKKMVEYL